MKSNSPETGPAAILLLLAAGLATGCARPDAGPTLPGAARGRNLILITIDTLRADRLGAYGYRIQDVSPTPRLDELMASGVRFARATAPRALTWPSLASVLTGLYPSAHGVVENGYEFPDGLPTLPNILQAQGYRTGRFLSNMCRANHTGWDASFCSQGVDGKINPRATEWLDSLEPDASFFLWVHYFGAHSPYYNGGDRAAKRLDPGYEGPVLPKKKALNRLMTQRTPLTERDVRHLDAIYDAAVMGSDRFVGELLDALRQRGLLEDSLTILLSDHGEDLWDHHGYIYHACSVYESCLHVPLAFVAPDLLPGGVVVQQSVELLDVMPTVLELLGVGDVPTMHGRSLVGHLGRFRDGGGRPSFSEYGASRIHTALADDWKLVDNPDHESPYCLAGAGEDHYPLEPVELYNLAEDPLETRNLAARYPERVAELQALIQRRFADLPRNLVPQEVPEELKEELRALGYVAD